MAALNALPNELLSLVTNHLDRPRDLVNLAISNRRLYEFAKFDGWKAFLKGRFGLAGLDADAKNSVHGLTTLYRNWDRKAFVARYLEPSPNVTSLNSWGTRKWRGPQGQTMGYQPHIDSYEEMHGAWTERREVLAWSAGNQIVMRVKETGSKAARAWEDHQETKEELEGRYVFDHFRHQASWYTYKIPESIEGRDDITALKLLRPYQKDNEFEGIAFGTASGELSLLGACLTHQETTEQIYETNDRSVGSISVSSTSDPLMAVSLGDTSLALYPTNRGHESDSLQYILSEVSPVAAGARVSRIWSCNFISNDKVALGLGPSYEPIQVYEITPDGFLSEPLRKFHLDSKYWDGTRTDRSIQQQRSTSIYPIVPIPSTSQDNLGANQLFLSGGYDGIVRLHDMRSPRGFESLFWDVTNDSAIYSLACQGLERIVVGSSMHSMIKVFDMRFAGSHNYHTIPAITRPLPKRKDYAYNAIVKGMNAEISHTSGGWNLFLNPRKQVQQNGQRHPNRPTPRTEDSPVYSISIPSATSPNIYTGLEGTVQNLTFLSVTDPYPDQLLSQQLTRFPDTQKINIKTSYNPSDDVLHLGMYEQGTEEGLGMQLLAQDGVWSGLTKNKARKDFARHRGLDERWKDPTEDGERWVRGQEPPQNVRRGGGRGRGRGRGRGHF